MGEMEIDFVNRDPNSLNGNLMVAFVDIIGEPDGAHSTECAYKCGYKCYEGGKNICYKLLGILCAWAHGLCWGCNFACLTFCYIWEFTPCLKCSDLVCGTGQKLFTQALECIIGPCCSTCGMFFSQIKVTQG